MRHPADRLHRAGCPSPKGSGPFYRTLCQLLSGPADAALLATLQPDHWYLLAATAQREGVAPLLYHALKERRSGGAGVRRSGGAEERRSGGAEGRRSGGEPSSSPYSPTSPSPLLLCVPPDVQAVLRQTYYATAARNLLIYQELARVLAALTTARPRGQGDKGTRGQGDHLPISPSPHAPISPSPPLPVILLKGAALATTLYDSIALRPLGDVDLLVPEERLAEAVARLKALGYAEPHPEMAPGLNALAGHHVHLQGGQDVHLAVELHWTLIGGPHDWRSPSLPWFWEQTEEWRMENGEWKLESNLQPPTSNLQPPIRTPHSEIRNPKSEIRILTPTAHLLYLCAHLMLQHGEARSVLRWFYDIHLLVEREGQRIAWDELVDRAREFRWAPAVYGALEGSRDRFGTRLPEGLPDALAEADDGRSGWLVARGADPLQTRATGTVAAASALSPRARLRLLLAIACPSPEYMRWRYKPRPAWLWPLYYLYRWLDILRDGLSTLWRVGKGKMDGGKGERDDG